jgi:UDP-N-acetylmuramoyl-tripeptide--D-alanyl-D-alanine ligase
MDVPVERVQYAVSKIEQVEHRLSLKRTAGGITIIDDAFNSNPDGSRMALDVLASMKKGKRIVVTPGMIELGDKQYQYNEELGRRIAASVDVAIVVGAYNRDAILSGLRDAGMPEEKVIVVDTFKEAQARLGTLLAAGDAVLYENDLPDTFK